VRAYITDFFKKQAFLPSDSHYLLSAYDKIMQDKENAPLWCDLLSLYEKDINCDYDLMMQRARSVGDALGIHRYTAELLLFVCLSKQLLCEYRKRGISEDVWYNSMCDLRFKLDECKEVYGIRGSFVAPWFIGFFKLKRFALGRLQFELTDFNRNYSCADGTLTPESKVINIHIPRSGKPLSPALCDEAFCLAKRFFEGMLGDGPIAFVCSSWLLFPKQKEFLAKGTNVLAFMERFDIIESKENTESYPDIWRLFDRNYNGDPDTLPRDGSLRRAYADHIKKGGRMGSGFGVFFYKE